MDEKFWLQDPAALLKLSIIPTMDMTMTQKLNAATRLLLVVTLVLYVLGYEPTQYLTILGLGWVLILVVHMNTKTEGFTSDCGATGYDPILNRLNAAYEVTPPIQFNPFNDSKRSYMNAKYELNPLTDEPGFKEIWRAEPEMMGNYSMVADPETVFPVAAADEHPSQENYIVRSKIDHLGVAQAQTDLYGLRPLAEADYLQSTLNFRENIMNEHIDKLVRARKHGCGDMRLMSTNSGGGGAISTSGEGGSS